MTERKRIAAKGWVTRANKALDLVLRDADVNKTVLLDAMDEFDKRLATLDEIQMEYELECADLESAIDEAADFREKARMPRVEAAQLLASMTDEHKETDSIVSRETKPDVKLPKLVLPKFDGDVLQWQSFWDQFTAVIHNSELPEVNKFTYLRSLLEGEAKEAIQGLSLTARHYKDACEILMSRFGREERIIFGHVQELLSMSSIGKQPSLVNLRKLQDRLLSHVRSLECLGISGEQYGVLLTPIVLSSLPSDIRMEWARGSEGRESDLRWLLEFLNRELKLRETSQTFKNLKSPETNFKKEERRPRPSVTVLQSASQSNSGCNVCRKPHPTYKCWDLVKVSQYDRREKIKRKGLCYRCLVKGHLSTTCEKSCERCKGPHHLILCRKPKDGDEVKIAQKSDIVPEKSEKIPEKSENAHTGVCTLTSKQATSEVMLQTIELEVRGRSGIVEAHVLFDNGSDRSYVSTELVKRIDPEFYKSEFVAYCAFGSDKASKEEMRNLYSFDLRGHSSGCGVVTATEVPVVCAPLYRRKVPEGILRSFGKLQLVEDYSRNKQVKIDILIGLDQYWKFMKPEIIPLYEDSSNLVAQKTIFGWILSGSYGTEKPETDHRMAHQLLCVQNVSDADLQRLWDIDLEVGKNLENPVLQKFTENIVMKEGRYEVALPWKCDEKPRELLNNYGQAEMRLKSLTRKLDKDTQLKKRYNEALKEMENNKVIEEVPSDEMLSGNPIFYLPHRPVVRETSVSTKVRPVFDASAKGSNNLSLNECVETGPNLIPSLVAILLRFRRWPIAIVADIQKAFLQISVKPEDRDVHRFLWNDNDVQRIMRFVRVPFGNRSSPFILNATIKYHLRKFETSHVISELEENLYVDDWLTGADREDEATDMIKEASDVMSQCKMNLTKFGSNNKEVLEKVLCSLDDKCEHSCDVKVLGLLWNPEEDCFMFEGITVEPGLIITKRVILSLIVRLFDPLGFLNPFVIKLKCLFQDLWRLGVEWDAELNEEFGTQALTWIKDLSLLKDWRVIRSYTRGPWKDIVSINLDAFGDASEKAYGACVYLVAKQKDGSSSAMLTLSKTKVAPVKKVTLPRLELLGALLAAQLLDVVRDALKLDIDCCRCWSDSTVTLSWIKGDPARWKPFVANRVSQIQQITSPSMWSHCLGKENPADLLTRGISASELMKSELWLRGPTYLLEEHLPVELEFEESEDHYAAANAEKLEKVLISVMPEQSKLFDVERWGTLIKAIRVVAWVLRFLHNSRGLNVQSGELSLGELEKAKVDLIRSVQRQAFSQEMKELEKGDSIFRKSKLYKCSPYLDEDGLLRVKGRLDFSDLTFDEKHPIIIPRSHFAVLVVRYQHILLKHAGVNAMLTSLRSTYWIFGARRIAKRVKRLCVSCQKQDVKHAEQPVAPLHKSRVEEAKPFAVTGMDHAGPMYCSDYPGKKIYLLLFTCAAIRAVHLELVNSLNLEDCMYAIRRFIARRGMPSVIWSDNAKTFIAAKQKLLQTYGDLCPQWNYIVPRSPWWGGWWERLVRSVTTALRKSIGQKCLTKTELETVLHEVEACVNSRPLTFVGDEVNDRSPLTPAHFLIGRSNVYEQEKLDGYEVKVTKEDLENRILVKNALMDRFWSIWTQEYIRHLPTYKGSSRQKDLADGSLVLVRQDGCPRMSWPVGVILESYSGKDGVIRSCKVRTRKGDLVRSIQRLHLLELEQSPVVTSKERSVSSDEVQTEESVSDPVPEALSEEPERTYDVSVTLPDVASNDNRFGRKIKPVCKLNS